MKSNKFYLVRAIYDWCNDAQYTPYLLVDTSFSGIVLPKLSLDRKMVLNISGKATKDLSLTHEAVEFHANFDQKVEKVKIPIDAIFAIYAYENGEGITFDEDEEDDDGGDGGQCAIVECDNDAIMTNKKTPSLKIIK